MRGLSLNTDRHALVKDRPRLEEVTSYRGSEAILVIDDDEFVADYVANVLETFGYRVFTASNGYEGLDSYNENKDEIDAVILDIMMPGMNGAEVYRRLHGVNPDLPILIISGYVETEVAQLFPGNRLPKSFLQKPFLPVDLMACLRFHFDQVSV